VDPTIEGLFLGLKKLAFLSPQNSQFAQKINDILGFSRKTPIFSPKLGKNR
jgi:hypothetical protein